MHIHDYNKLNKRGMDGYVPMLSLELQRFEMRNGQWSSDAQCNDSEELKASTAVTVTARS